MSEQFSDLPPLELPSLVNDPRHHALTLAARRHAEEVYSILGGDLDILRDFYDEIACAFDDGLDEADELADLGESEKRAASLIAYKQDFDDMMKGVQAQSEARRKQYEEQQALDRAEYLRNRNSWSVKTDFFRHDPTGRRWGAVLEKVSPLTPPKDPQAFIIKILKAEGPFMENVEPAMREYAAQSGHEVALSRKSWIEETPSEEMAEKKNKVIFLVDDILQPHCFRAHILAVINKAILANTPDVLLDLAAYKSLVPQSFPAVFPEDFDLWPGRITAFHNELEQCLTQGLQIKEARTLGAKFHLDDRQIVLKTWLDQRVDHGELEKSKRDGKVAYFSPGYAPLER